MAFVEASSPPPSTEIKDRSLPNGEKVYYPQKAKAWWDIVIVLLIGLLAAAEALSSLILWISKGEMPSFGSFFLTVSAICFIGMGVLLIFSALRGLPRLRLDAEGVRLETALGTRWGHWASLGPFVLTSEEIGLFKRRVLSARTDIIGPATSHNLQRSKKLIISDAFVTPIDAIVVDLQSRSAQAMGTPAELTLQGAPEDVGKEFGIADFKIPWLTFIILGALAAAFGVEQIFAIDGVGPLFPPSMVSLLALGGLNPAAVLSRGEWYRLFTAPLLHADLNHLILNGIALVMAGYLLERLVGRRWFLAFFVIGGIGGTLMALMLDAANVVSVGASGAIMGLFAAAFIGSFRLRAATHARARIQIRSVQILIPSLLPLWTTAAVGRIDYAAHIGGALSCAVVMAFLLKAWPDTAGLPRFGRLAGGVAATGLILFLASTVAVATHYSAYHPVGPRSASIAVDRYRLPPAGTMAPQLTDDEQALLTDCRISRGDPIEVVKTAYGVPYAPQKLERKTPAGTAYQYHFERYGIWVFFDDRMLVSSVRLEEPFRGAVQGVAIGVSSDRLRAAKGAPIRQFQGFGLVNRGAPPVLTTAWVYAPERPSFTRYDILDGKVRSILAYSCTLEPAAW